MKFYIQNGQYKKVIDSKTKKDALERFFKRMFFDQKAVKDKEVVIRSLTYVSQAGFFKDIFAYGDKDMIHNSISMEVTGTCIRKIHGFTPELVEGIANDLEGLLIAEKNLKGTKRVIQEFMDELKT